MTHRILRSLAIFCLLAPALSAQSTSTEIAQLRAELQRAPVRIEMLERAVLAAPASQRVTPSRVDLDNPPSIRPLTRQAATVSFRYICGPKSGCFTFSATRRKKYVDRSLCD